MVTDWSITSGRMAKLISHSWPIAPYSGSLIEASISIYRVDIILGTTVGIIALFVKEGLGKRHAEYGKNIHHYPGVPSYPVAKYLP